MMSFLEALFRALGGLFGALSPKNVRKAARAMPILAPVALRSIRKRLARHSAVGLCLGAGIAIFLVLSASFTGAARAVASHTARLDLPADVIALGIPGDQSRSVADLAWVAQAGAYELFGRSEAVTSVGRRWIVGVGPESRLWAKAAGGQPVPGPGEIYLPADLASLQPPETVAIAGSPATTAASQGATTHGATSAGAGAFAGQAYRVAGISMAGRSLFSGALVMNLTDFRAVLGPAATDAVAVWERDPGDADRLRTRVADMFPAATIWWPDLPSRQAALAVGGFLSPGALVRILVFIMAGLGVFNVMLLSLLQRKAQLGVMKALGAEDDEVFLLLLLEAGIVAAAGAALGLAAGVVLVGVLDRSSLAGMAISPGSVAWAVALAGFSFLLAAWLPATLCRRASPVQLMAGRRLYLNPRSTCAQCGRCGGF